MSFVQIRHPDIHGTVPVPESAVSHWRKAGWEPVPPNDTADASNVQLVEREPSE